MKTKWALELTSKVTIAYEKSKTNSFEERLVPIKESTVKDDLLQIRSTFAK